MTQESLRLTIRAFERSAQPTYLNQFLHYAGEYVEVMQEFAANDAVVLLDMRERFAAERVEFVDVCHFQQEGHALVAERLAETIDLHLPGSTP